MDKMACRLSKGRRLWLLFLSTLQISAFTFGGGFVIVTLMKRKFVDGLHWLDEEEMLDLTALAQTSPGAIAVNAAMLVGRRVAGRLGLLVGMLGTLLPPMVIIAAISAVYAAFATNPYVALVLRGMQAGVAAVIADVVCKLGSKVTRQRSLRQMLVMLGAFVATAIFRVNAIYVILAAALVGAAGELLRRRKEARE